MCLKVNQWLFIGVTNRAQVTFKEHGWLKNSCTMPTLIWMMNPQNCSPEAPELLQAESLPKLSFLWPAVVLLSVSILTNRGPQESYIFDIIIINFPLTLMSKASELPSPFWRKYFSVEGMLQLDWTGPVTTFPLWWSALPWYTHILLNASPPNSCTRNVVPTG